jgi:hypothetical protein
MDYPGGKFGNAEQTLVHYNEKSIPWDGEQGLAAFLTPPDFESAVEKCEHRENVQRALQTVRFIQGYREKHSKESLFSLVLKTRYSEATAFPDYGAALFELANDWNPPLCGLTPEYDNHSNVDSAHDVAHDMARDNAKHAGNHAPCPC